MRYAATDLFLIILVLFTLPLNTSWNEETVSDDNQMDPVLIQFKTDPLNINTASFSDLQLLPWLSEVQIKDIISYRTTRLIKRRKQLIELGIDEFTLDEMEDYIVFSSKPEINFLSVVRAELKRSKLEHSSCLNLYSKHIFTRGNLEAGFITQKDELESNLLDFYSYYFQLKDQGPMQKIIIGKYQLYYGLGILMQSKLGSSKNINAAGNLLRIRTTIAPYRSAYESWALEGCSAQLKFGSLKFIPFFSHAALSANLESGKITSFNETGLNYDLKEKNNVRESIWGLFTELEWKNHIVNFVMLQQKFDHSFSDEEKKSRTRSVGFCVELWKNLFPLRTELVWSNGSTGILSSLAFVSNNIRQQVIFRKYAKDLPAWHGNPFAARSNFPNEEGFYYGITASSFAGLKINFYMDIWRLPETSYLEKMPVTGNEIMLKCSVKLPEKNFLSGQVRFRNKEKYITLEEGRIRDLRQTVMRFDWDKIIGKIRLRSRLEFVSDYLHKEEMYTDGTLFSQLIKYQNNNLKCVFQLASFDTEILEYIYEYNVDGAMSSAVLSGNDMYYNLLLSVAFLEKIKVQSKISGWLRKNDKMKISLQVSTSL